MEMLFVNAGISTPLNVRDYVVAVWLIYMALLGF
jgi:hypothetical protein